MITLTIISLHSTKAIRYFVRNCLCEGNYKLADPYIIWDKIQDKFV